MLIRGTCLIEVDQTNVLNQYIHRYTKDHKPSWVTWQSVQFESDQDWLENTFFKVTKQGRLDKRVKYCESHPTWPEGMATK